jgi:hypothetical protein
MKSTINSNMMPTYMRIARRIFLVSAVKRMVALLITLISIITTGTIAPECRFRE